MKKIIILTTLACIILALYFVPVSLEKTTAIKSSFFNVYEQLSRPEHWKRWRPDLRNALFADSNQLSVKKGPNSFTISRGNQQLNVNLAGTLINITDKNKDTTTAYSYFVVPDNPPDKTLITVYKDANLFTYLLNKLEPVSFADTHVNDLKHFMETDSLLYGFNILKTKVTDDKLLVILKDAPAKTELAVANNSLNQLKQFIKKNKLNQTAPLIAQFTPKNNDSVQVKVGIYIDREINSYKDITFERMPKGGNLRAAKFTGRFNERNRAYDAMQRYFNDHSLQQGILPFEVYTDNKLPVNDTDKINIKLLFATLF